MMYDESNAISEQRLRTAITQAVSSALPSDDEFRASVLGKLAARKETQRRLDDSPSMPGLRWFRAAASLLPAGFSQAAFAGSSAAKGVAAKSLAGKALGVALVPLFAFALVAASFATAVSKTVGLDGDRGRVRPDQLGRLELVAWVKAKWSAVLVMTGLFALLTYAAPLDAGVFVLAVSMLSTAIVVQRLSDQGMCDRRAVEVHVVNVTFPVMAILGALAGWTSFKHLPNSGLIALTGYWLAIASAVVIAIFHRRYRSARTRLTAEQLARKDRTAAISRGLVLGLVWTVFVGFRPHAADEVHRLAAGQVDVLSLRLPLAALLHVVFTTLLLARAPKPTARRSK